MQKRILQTAFLLGIGVFLCIEPIALYLSISDQSSDVQIPFDEPFKETEDDLDEIDVEIEKLKLHFCLRSFLDQQTLVSKPNVLFVSILVDKLDNPYLSAPDVPRGPPSVSSCG